MDSDNAERSRLDSARRIAELVGVGADTIKLWARKGLIPSVRISSKVVRFEWPAVLAALRERGMNHRSAGGR